MWYEVQKLTASGLNKSQIKRETGLDRATIRKYQQISEDEFHKWVQEKRRMPKKLQNYHDYVKKELELKPYLSASQIEDRLKENYDNLPKVHSKTVYNFVETIRKTYNIVKPKTNNVRTFEKLLEVAYGSEAQVDFGETWMQTKEGKRQKVYFYSIVLSRSRYKYFQLRIKPFTSKTTIQAQEAAFEYFAGVPNKIIYDQDSVFISDENLGSYKLTKEFSSYCDSSDFKAVFCRKADPQSKGKIENVVKYIKQNFLRGRDFKDIETLNKQALDWLDRTGNGKKHQTTQFVPKHEFIEEQKHLLPLKQNRNNQSESYKSYKVRKDNTICYKSNYYSLPLGTYKNQETSVLIQLKEYKILIFDEEKNPICTHILNNERGKIIRNTDHKREKSKTLEGLVKSTLEYFGNTEISKNYLNLLQKNMSRYYRDNLQYLIKNTGDFSDEIKKDTLIFCIENKVYNAKELIEILKKKQLENEPKNIEIKQIESESKHKYNFDIEKSKLSNYEKILS
jgi:transposase